MTSPVRRWSSALVVFVAAGVSAAARADAGAPPLADDPTLVALAVALSCADAPDGAIPGTAAAPQSAPEVELVATVRASSLVFDEVPKLDAILGGKGARRLAWKAERVNLPERPDPGFVYRDVVVRVTVAGDLDDLTALLADAKRASRGLRIETPPPPASVAKPVEGRPKIADVSPTSTSTSSATPTATATEESSLPLPPPPPPPVEAPAR
jgi:hypothetical protein